jgi:hypothetical protein
MAAARCVLFTSPEVSGSRRLTRMYAQAAAKAQAIWLIAKPGTAERRSLANAEPAAPPNASPPRKLASMMPKACRLLPST